MSSILQNLLVLQSTRHEIPDNLFVNHTPKGKVLTHCWKCACSLLHKQHEVVHSCLIIIIILISTFFNSALQHWSTASRVSSRKKTTEWDVTRECWRVVNCPMEETEFSLKNYVSVKFWVTIRRKIMDVSKVLVAISIIFIHHFFLVISLYRKISLTLHCRGLSKPITNVIQWPRAIWRISELTHDPWPWTHDYCLSSAHLHCTNSQQLV